LQSPPHRLLSLCDIIPTNCDAHVYKYYHLQREEEEKATTREKKKKHTLLLKMKKEEWWGGEEKGWRVVLVKQNHGTAIAIRPVRRAPLPITSSSLTLTTTRPTRVLFSLKPQYTIVFFLFAFPLFLSSDFRALVGITFFLGKC
jgi:hypothetical protein